jgi:hypothetical protein
MIAAYQYHFNNSFLTNFNGLNIMTLEIFTDTLRASDSYNENMKSLLEILCMLFRKKQQQSKENQESNERQEYFKKEEPLSEPDEKPNSDLIIDSPTQQKIHSPESLAKVNGSGASVIAFGGTTQTKELSANEKVENIENLVAAAVATNLAESFGKQHQNGFSYKADDYIINGNREADGSTNYQVRSIQNDGIRLVLDFNVAEGKGSEGITLHSADLSEFQRSEFLQAGESIANKQEYENLRYVEKHQALGSLAPYGSRAAVLSDEILRNLQANEFQPILDINSSTDPYTISRQENGITITDNASGQVILTASNNQINAEKFTARNQSDFKQLYHATRHGHTQEESQTEQSPAISPIETNQETKLQPEATVIQNENEIESIERTEHVSEALTADELVEWLTAVEASGGSQDEFNEVLAYASEARKTYPDEFKRIKEKNQSPGASKDSAKKIAISMPRHLSEKRRDAVKVLNEMQSDYGSQGVIRIIEQQKSSPVKITNPDKQIEVVGGKPVIKGTRNSSKLKQSTPPHHGKNIIPGNKPGVPAVKASRDKGIER